MSHIPDNWQVATAACFRDCRVVTNKSQQELVYTGKENTLRRAYLSGRPLHSLVDSHTLILSSVLRTYLEHFTQCDVLRIYIRYRE